MIQQHGSHTIDAGVTALSKLWKYEAKYGYKNDKRLNSPTLISRMRHPITASTPLEKFLLVSIIRA
jgi:hypothetical protein